MMNAQQTTTQPATRRRFILRVRLRMYMQALRRAEWGYYDLGMF